MMAKTIWKFPIRVAEEQRVVMPAHAKILHVGIQGDAVCLWAQVNQHNGEQERVIRIFGTGHPMLDEPGAYIGTFMLEGGAYVFHAYDATP